MAGVGDSGGGFMARLSRQTWTSRLRPCFHNAGIGGNTVADMLGRAPALSALRPYDLIVLLGCNDLPRAGDFAPEKRSSPDDYASRLKALLTAIRGERSLFVSSFAVSEKATGIAPALFEEYTAAATGIAASCGYEVWDLFHEIRPGDCGLLSADGLHLNDSGHALVASRLTGWVEGWLR